MDITDKELLAICNLSNLKMEFADVAKDKDREGKILSNHTIYSLLKNEYDGIEERKKIGWKKFNLEEEPEFPLEGFMNNVQSEYKEKYEKEREKFINYEKKYRTSNLGSFSTITDNKEKIYTYWNKDEMRKKAPMVMEYFDRYRIKENSAHEGAFLKDWEIIYGADYYELLIDYAYMINKNIYTSLNKPCPSKEKFKEEKMFVSREKLKRKEETAVFLNFAWDLFSLLSIPSKVFEVADYMKGIIENLRENGIIDEITSNFFEKSLESKLLPNEEKEFKNKLKEVILFKLNGELKLKLIDFRVVVLRNKNTNDFVVAFNNFNNSQISDALQKKGLSFDLLAINEVLIDKILDKQRKGIIKITYTGYNTGGIAAIYSHAILEKITSKMEAFQKNSSKLVMQDRTFMTNEIVNKRKIASFDIEDLLTTSHDIEYTPTFNGVFLSFIETSGENIKGTLGISIAGALMSGKSEVETVAGNLFKNRGNYLSNIGKSKIFILGFIKSVPYTVYLAAMGYILFSKYYSSKKLEMAYMKMIESGIIEKELDVAEEIAYGKINEEFLKKPSLKELKGEIDSSQLYPLKLKSGLEKTVYLPKELVLLLCLEDYKRIGNEIIVKKNSIKFFNDTNKMIGYYPIRYSILLDDEDNYLDIREYWLVTERHHRERNIKKISNIQEKKSSIPKEKIVENARNKFILFTHHAVKVVTEEGWKNKIISMGEYEISLVNDFMRDVNEFSDIMMKSSLKRIKNKRGQNGNKILLKEKIKEYRIFKNLDLSKEILVLETLSTVAVIQKKYDEKSNELENSTFAFMKTLNQKQEYSEFIFFPYIQENGKIGEIRNEYIGSLLRRCYKNKEIKYNTLDEEQESDYFATYHLYSESRNKNEIIDKELINRVKKYSKPFAYLEHHESAIKKLETNPEIIREFYEITITSEKINKGIIEIGIFSLEDRKKYGEERIGYIYNNDELYGRLIALEYYFSENEELSEISTYGVCQGAKLWCSEGDAAGTLLVTSQDFEYTDGNLDVTLGDNKAFTNITPFGRCSCNKKKSCSKYISLGEWSKMSTGTEINNKKSILSTSTITCQEGGTIIILDPKNKTFNN